MDERVLERMVARSGRTIKSSSVLAIAASSIFLSAIFWIILRVLLGGIGGVFRYPLLFMTASFAMLPMTVVLVPLAAWCLSARSGHEPLPLYDGVHQRWKHAVALFLYALGVSVIELILGILVAVWCGIEAVPVFGTAVYVFFSWVPTVLTLLMGAIFLLHGIILLVVGPYLAQTPALEQKGLFADIPSLLTREWILRIKLLCVGILPTILLYAACSAWTMKGLPQGIEFCASIFRVAAFSVLEAPLFLFLVHMAVEADRYIQWLSVRRVG